MARKSCFEVCGKTLLHFYTSLPVHLKDGIELLVVQNSGEKIETDRDVVVDVLMKVSEDTKTHTMFTGEDRAIPVVSPELKAV